MKNTQESMQKPEPNQFIRFLNSSFGRFLLIGMITLVLIAPLSSVIALIRERKYRAEEMKEEIRNEWGDDFIYKGLVLRIPLKGKKSTNRVFFFPETEKTNLHVNTSIKKRGIYHFPVFQTNNYTSAGFTPDLHDPELDLTKAQVGLLALSNTRLQTSGKLRLTGKDSKSNRKPWRKTTRTNYSMQQLHSLLTNQPPKSMSI